MKELIKNDDGVSVVVGSILVLAVLVTFMSVVTSSWVPIYEGNAEADHSDEVFDTFVDLNKQIENADEQPKSTNIKLGTDEMPFISNTNSVGHMEVNESVGGLTLTTEIQHTSPVIWMDDSFSVRDLNLSQQAPIKAFSISFVLDNVTSTNGDCVLPNGFSFTLQSDTLDPLKITIEGVGDYSESGYAKWKWNDGNGMKIRYEYTDFSGNVERWEQTWNVVGDIQDGDVDGITWSGDGVYSYLDIDLLNPVSTLTLEYPYSTPVTVNGISYNVNEGTSLYNLSQHYLKQPDDGTYDLYYTNYAKIIDSNLILLYNTTADTVEGTTTSINNVTIGSGTLTLSSDYNYFTDQSYIYDSGAIILLQNEGSVFKICDAPIYVRADPDNNLMLNLKTTILEGDCQASGNNIETIQTMLNRSYSLNGFTDNVTITKDTTPELKDLWDSYFEDINSTISATTANSTYYPDNMTLHIWSNDANILLRLEQKKIIIA
jgi:hypothetical protein